MANAIYPKFKEAILQASANSSMGGSGTTGVYCALVDTGVYTYNSAHDFYDDLSTSVVGTPVEIGSKTFTNGTFDGADITFTTVSGASVEALVTYVKNAGANSTWRLIHYVDTGATGLPVTPNGGDISVTWNASGIFLISDRRCKENIREIGSIGVLPIYEYNYNGIQERQVGFMAQEVEKIAPHAIVEFRAKRGVYKAVNYGAAVDAALRLAA